MILIEKEIAVRWSARLCCKGAAWLLCLGSPPCANAIQASLTVSQASPVQSRVNAPHAPTPDAGRPGLAERGKRSSTSSSDQEPAQAIVVFKDGNLTVDANNSDLEEILRAVARVTGMSIDGSVRSSRVFGIYGPHNPRDVLTDLLAGSGYNFIMVGVASNGSPKELQLSAEKSVSLTAPSATTPSAPRVSDTRAQDENQLGPGAIAHVPPAPPADTEERVRQNLQRLRQMHDKLKDQNAPQ